MLLKLLLTRPISIAAIHLAPSMESGRNSPNLKFTETACMSTNANDAASNANANDNELLNDKITDSGTPFRNTQHSPSHKPPVAGGTNSAVVGGSGGGVSKFHRSPMKAAAAAATALKKRGGGVEPVSKFRSLISTTGKERLAREFRDVKCIGMPQVRELKLCDNDLFHWKFLLLPDTAPYNKKAFPAEIIFPTSYPQMAPVITVQNIYHPNVNEAGFVCLHCLSHWTHTMKMEDVLQKLVALIRDPEPHHPMRFDVADEYLKDRETFMRKAFAAAKAFGVPRRKH